MNKGFRTICLKAYDVLKNGNIFRYYSDVKNRNDNVIPNKEELSRLLKWSVENTQYYKNFDPKDIQSFPVLTKNIIREKRDDLIAPYAKGKDLYTVSTSGSTGIPLSVVWSRNKRSHQIAEMIYYYEKAGTEFGQKILFFRGNPQQKSLKNKIKEWLENIYEFDVTTIDDSKMKQIIHMLTEDSSISCCIGYGSFNEEMLNYLIRNKIDKKFKPQSIITSSEVTSRNCKTKLADLTGVKVYDRYSNSENGFIAQTDSGSEEFKVNVAGFYVEILKMDSDEPAEKNEVGRIVITDLYNVAMPMIRYDTGDLAAYSEKVDGWVTVLHTIQGRQSDIIYNTVGAKITTSSWNTYMNFPLMRQYQLVQEGKKQYTLKVNCDKGIYEKNDIVNALKKTLGMDAEITIEYVDEIPQLSSGKFRKTICNYHPEEDVK